MKELNKTNKHKIPLNDVLYHKNKYAKLFIIDNKDGTPQQKFFALGYDVILPTNFIIPMKLALSQYTTRYTNTSMGLIQFQQVKLTENMFPNNTANKLFIIL